MLDRCAAAGGVRQTYRMRIEGYEDGPLVAGEPLVTRPGFWSSHLWGPCCRGVGAEPEWFGDDGADVDALSEVLLDPQRWPVIRVPVEGGHTFVVVYRNFVDDYGVDYLVTHPGWRDARRLAGWEGSLEGETLRWRELIRVASSPGAAAEGIDDPDTRLLLLLPLLSDPAPPDEATETVAAALIAVGAPQGTASATARQMLEFAASGPWHDSAWGPPVTDGSRRSRPVDDGILARLGID